jgi:hypothetical protein
MTWREFKEAAESQGIRDDDEIMFIDWNDNHVVDVEEAHTDDRRRWWIT